VKHWTEELFLDNAELFLILFDERPERVTAEADALLKSLNGQGYQPERVLDMNCGIGRHDVTLAKKGIEVLGTDMRNLQPSGFRHIGDILVLEDRTFNMNDSRMYNTWTYLKKTTDDMYTLLKNVKLDHRVWSLHELIAMFERTGWKFKAAYSGLTPDPDLGMGIPLSGERDVMRAMRLLVISYRE
jgi:hypothetical protein